MTRPLAIDLFCGAGGASMGLYRAGFDVIGVDSRPQPRYPFRFIQGDALKPPLDLSQADFIWASPPCQAHSSLRSMWNAREHADNIPQTRVMLSATGLPFTIENVIGAPLRHELVLCGTMFGLKASNGADLRRHRKFETSWQWPLFSTPQCQHASANVIGVYGGGGRDKRWGSSTQNYPVTERRSAMGIDWMTGAELSQAIPPAYSEFIGRAALASMMAEAV